MLNAKTEDQTPDTELDDVIGDIADEGDEAPIIDDDDAVTDDEDGDATPDPNAAAGDDQPAQQVSRRTARVQKLEKERDEANQREALLRQQLADVQAAQRNDPQRAEQARQEAARVAAMDPEERERYQDRQQIAALQSQVQNLGFAQEDGLDRARFEAKAELNPVYKKYANAVEKTLGEMRAKGVNSTREAILTYKLGEAAREKLEVGSVGGQRRRVAAEGRVRSAQGRPANVRGDTGGGRAGKTEEDRLRGMQI
jgi:hypothetical protein